MKVSTLYYRASSAAEELLPAESLVLIKRRDDLADAWGKAGYPPIMEQTELLAASRAVDADPLAHAAMELRILGSRAAEQERKESQNSQPVGAAAAPDEARVPH